MTIPAPPSVFDRAWFDQHQRSLVTALNVPGLGRELRAALGIRQPGRVITLRPDGYLVDVDPADAHAPQIAVMHTGPVFARGLQRAGMPLWRLAHWFDQHVANPLLPALNLGFDTLTCYPQPWPATTAADGQTARLGVDETFSFIRGAVGNFGDDTFADIYAYFEASATTNQYQQLRRCVMVFDSSIIGANKPVVLAKLGLWGLGKNNGLGVTTLEVVSSSPIPPTQVQATDYNLMYNFSTTSFGTFQYASYDDTDSAYSEVVINPQGRSLIDPASITKYGARLGWDLTGDFNGTWTNPAVTYFRFASADNASGTAKAPALTVTLSKFLLTRP